MAGLRRVGLLCALLCVHLWTASAQAQPQGGEAEAARALHLLSYIGADYPATVQAGQVVDAGEYQEQLEFLTVVNELLSGLPAKPEQAQLLQQLAQLKQAVSTRAEGTQVAQQARQLASQLVLGYEVSQTPAITPDPARGEPIYAQQCSVCHGATGAGDGPAGVGLTPAPSNLRNTSRMDRLSLYDLFNTLSLGVDGTDMVGFADQLSERERWDLASYIAGFSAQAAPASQATFNLTELASKSPAEVAAASGDAAAFRALRAHPPVEKRGPAELIQHTVQTLGKSLAAYQQKDRQKAYELSVGAYLEGFELVESALNNIDSEQRKTAEKALMAYRQALQDDAGLERAEQALGLAKLQLNKSAELLEHGAMSGSLSFFSSLLILLREGVEAILVLAAILAFLNKTGQQQAVRSVHIGWGLALLAGFVTWAVAAYLLDVSGASRELLEGATALFASAMVLWLGVWMHDRRHASAWQDYIKRSLVGSSGRFGFAVLAFFAVYRELFEVILFYETLWLQAGPAGHGMVIAGAAAALVLLVGLAWIILRGSRQLPLATFFSINAALLCLLAIVFAGHGIVALQEAGVLGTHPVAFFDFDWLGIKADALSLSAQGLVLTLVALFYTRSWLAERKVAAA